jgi:hypothetical protein
MIDASFTVTPSTGDVYATEFAINNTTSSSTRILQYIWDFGDQTNLIYSKTAPTHYYQFPGIYTITLSAINIHGEYSTTSQQITADFAYRDYILFTQVPDEYSTPGVKTNKPFKVQVITSQLNKPVVLDLFAAGSKSTPNEFVSTRWTFLTPTWKFVDRNDNIITSIEVPTTPIYKNNKVVAVSGEAEFYYIDAYPTVEPNKNCPVLITCTLQTSGFTNPNDTQINKFNSYANNLTVKGCHVWVVHNPQPDFLKVTSNYIDPLLSKYWQDTKIPFIISAHSNRSTKVPGAEDQISEILFSYPQNSLVSLTAPVSVTLQNVSKNAYTIDEAPLYFKNKDVTDFNTGGYIFTTITSNTAIPQTSIYAAASSIYYKTNDDSFLPAENASPNSFLWVSNPVKNTLNKITLVPYPLDCKQIKFFKDNKILVDGNIKQITVPGLSTTSTFNYTVSGYSGIYGMAIDPRNFDLIACDAETEKIHRFSKDGEILNTLELSSFDGYDPITNLYTPAHISLDEYSNIWVSLFNTVSVLKLDPNFNLLLTTAPSGLALNSTFDSEFLIKPPVVETDKDNNCWVSYSHPLCSMLVKYNSNGNLLSQISLPAYSTPGSLAIDNNNNVWVANTCSVLNTPGNIQLYNTVNSTLIKQITGIPRPSYIALDRSNDLWFTHSLRGLGHYNTKTDSLTLWNFNNPSFTKLSSVNLFLRTNDINLYENDEDIGGMSFDIYNRLWLIDSQYNTATVIFSAFPNFTESRTFQIKPDALLGYYIDVETGKTITESLEGYDYRSAQATGDWTGNKWYQKYLNLPTFSKLLTGISNPFEIRPFANPYQFRRKNDSFDMKEYLQSLALTDILQRNPVLWDGFFAAAAGTGVLSANEDPGQFIYEKIANFAENHNDIELCNIDSLLSYSVMTDTPINNYRTPLPQELKNTLDTLSIPKHKLCGTPDNFPDLKYSFGDEIFLFTDYVSAGEKVIMKSVIDNSVRLFTIPPLSSDLYYPLSSIEEYTLMDSFNTKTSYRYYKFVPRYSGKYVENIIDWESPYTTLSPVLSTNNDWFKDEGIVETTFNYLLTKNLFHK